MRPPSYYNTLANANPSTSNRGGSTSQQLRSSFANSSSTSYATRSHLPFVSQSMLVAHCYTGAGSTTKPYGHQSHLQRSSSPVGFSSASSIYSSPTSYASSYTRPSSTAASRRPHLQHHPSFSGSYNSYSDPTISSSSSYLPTTSSSPSRGNAYCPASSSTATKSIYRAPPPRSSYLSSATLASLSTPHRVSAAASSSSSASSSYQRRPLATTSYYKPIRLRERPLLTQISRQLNTRYTPSSPSSRVPSVRQEDDARATPYTQPPGRATSRPKYQLSSSSASLSAQSQQKQPESDKEIEDKWSSDVARNISRNKYLIKFREFDKRASIAPIVGEESLPKLKDLKDPIELPPALAAPIVTAPTPTTPPPLDSLLGGQRDQPDKTATDSQSEQDQLLEPTSSYNISSSHSSNNFISSSSSGSSSKRYFVENNTNDNKDIKQTRVAESASNDDEIRDGQMKVPVQQNLDERKEQLAGQQSEEPVKFIEKHCVEKSVEETVEKSVDNKKSPEATGKKQVAGKKAPGKKVLIKKKGELKEKLVAEGTTPTGQVVVERQATLDRTIDRKRVEKSVEKPAEKLPTKKTEATTAAKKIIEQQSGDKKKPSEEKSSTIVKAAQLEDATNPEDSLAERKMKQQADCDKTMPATTIAKEAPAPTQAPPAPKITPKPVASPAPSQVNGTEEVKKVAKGRVVKLRLKAGATTGVCTTLKQTSALRSGQIDSTRSTTKEQQQPPPPPQLATATAPIQSSNTKSPSPLISETSVPQSQSISKTPSSPTINKTSPTKATKSEARASPPKTKPEVTESRTSPPKTKPQLIEAPEATPTATTAKPKVKKLIIKKTKLEDGETLDKPATRRRESNASSGAASPKKAKTKVKLAADRKVLGEKKLEENNIAEKTNNKMVAASPEPTKDTRAVENRKEVATPKTPKTPETPTITDGLSLNRPANNANKRIKFREYNIDDFDFLSVLGHGGWGFVILAELKEHDACFAVKCIKKITIVEDDDFDSILIERKMLTLGNINPFICKLFCTFETDGYLFFVMEYCAGGDLMFHVQKEGKFSEQRCRFYAAEIICAIRFLHNRHIIYRDLKLDNILLDSKGHVRLVDFGMCQCRTYREEMLPSNFCGTPEYISPEIIKGVPYNHSVDWWSFGVLLYEMAVGKMPFRGSDENELLWNVCYEQIHYPMFLTKELTSLLQSLLEREPTKRMGMGTCKAGDIYDQPWFRGVDWKATEEMRVKPPFVPEVTSNRDVRNFDDDFTQSAPELSPIDEETLQRIDQSQFQKFPYTNPDIFIFN